MHEGTKPRSGGAFLNGLKILPVLNGLKILPVLNGLKVLSPRARIDPGSQRSRRRRAAPHERRVAAQVYSVEEKVADGISGCTRKGPRVCSLGPSKVSPFGPLEPESSQRNVSR
jgi:hypothetical protein